MRYYPNSTLVMGMATLRRERRLPPNAESENELVSLGSAVEPSTVVLRGAVPSEYIILDGLHALGLRSPAELTGDMFRVPVGQAVEAGDVILAAGRKRLISPVPAIFARIEDGQAILQANPLPVEVLALTPGYVTSVSDRRVVIETTGAVVQGAWGNGLSVYTTLVLEPAGGLESIQGENDLLGQEYQGAAVLLRGPITDPALFAIAAAQSINALIAPGMSSALIPFAMQQNYPILLTEGFGQTQMPDMVYNLLRSNAGRPAAIDALTPMPWQPERPEVVIPIGVGASKPPTPAKDQPLAEGTPVRIARAPLAGQGGRVRRVIETPRTVENGLRLPGAEVQLADGAVVFVPLANLESVGRPPEAGKA
jgi:hypothetical protein